MIFSVADDADRFVEGYEQIAVGKRNDVRYHKAQNALSKTKIGGEIFDERRVNRGDFFERRFEAFGMKQMVAARKINIVRLRPFDGVAF